MTAFPRFPLSYHRSLPLHLLSQWHERERMPQHCIHRQPGLYLSLPVGSCTCRPATFRDAGYALLDAVARIGVTIIPRGQAERPIHRKVHRALCLPSRRSCSGVSVSGWQTIRFPRLGVTPTRWISGCSVLRQGPVLCGYGCRYPFSAGRTTRGRTNRSGTRLYCRTASATLPSASRPNAVRPCVAIMTKSAE